MAAAFDFAIDLVGEQGNCRELLFPQKPFHILTQHLAGNEQNKRAQRDSCFKRMPAENGRNHAKLSLQGGAARARSKTAYFFQ
jgi:hypothetical protein